MDGAKLFETDFPEVRVSYTPKDVMLYALGVGMGLDYGKSPGRRELRFLYEKDLAVLPTFANVLGPQMFWTADEEFGIDWKKLLHVEQRLHLHKPLPKFDDVTVQSRVTGIRDKGAGRGALVFQEKDLYEPDSGEALCSIGMTLLLRGDGACGDFGQAPEELPSLPVRMADLAIELYAAPALSYIYRLSGDYNPLHIDHGVANEAGFGRPVMHGLCSMGMICHALLKNFCSYQPDMLRELSMRFSHPVYPGDRLQLQCWDEGSGLIRFRAISEENGEIVVDRGIARTI